MRISVEPAFGTTDEVNRAFSHPAFTALKAGGAAFVLAAGDPLRVVWANRVAGQIFGAERDAALAARLFAGSGPAQRRLRFLATEGAIGGAPRMERLRFVRGLTVHVLTALWVRVPGPDDRPLFGLAVVAGSAPGADALNAVSTAWRDGTEETSLAEPVTMTEPVQDPISVEPDAIPAEPEAPSPPAPSFQQKAIAAFGGAETLRFRWRTDAADALAQIDDAMFSRLGADVPPLGRALADAVAVFDAEGAARLRHDLATRVSWSGLDLSWPADGGASLMPVVLGGSPMFDADRRFGGFRGFGLIRLSAIVPQTAPRASAARVSAEHSSAPRVSAEAPAIAAVPDPMPHAEAEPSLPPAEPVAAAEPSSPSAEPASASADDPRAGGEIDAGHEGLDASAPLSGNAAERQESPDLLATPFFGVPPADSLPPADIAPPSSLVVAPEEPHPTVAESEAVEALLPAESSPLPAPPSVKDSEPNAEAPQDELAADPVEVLPRPVAALEALSLSEIVGTAANVLRFRPVHGLVFSRLDAAAENSANLRLPEPQDVIPTSVSTLEPESETAAAVASLSPSERFAFDAIARVLKVPPEIRVPAEINASIAPSFASEDDASADAPIPAGALTGSDDAEPLAAEPVGAATMLEEAEPRAASAPPQPSAPIQALAPAQAVAETAQGSHADQGIDSDIASGAQDPSDRPDDLRGDPQAPIALLVCRDGRPLFANKALMGLLGFDAFAALAGADHPLFAMPEGDVAEDAAASGAPCPILLHDRSGGAVTLTGTAEPVDWNGGAATLWHLRVPARTPASIGAVLPSGKDHHVDALNSVEAPMASPAAATAAPIEAAARAEASQDHRDAYALLDAAGDALAILDEAGCIRLMNKVGCILFGSAFDGKSGNSFATLLASESQSYAAETLAALRGGTADPAPAIRDVVARRIDGSTFPLRLTLGRLSPTSFYAAMRDISELKRTERDLAKAEREAERASGRQPEFLAKVSHEIRTPLNAILGFAEVMMDERFGPLGNARYKDYLKDIHVSGTQVMSLVNDLLDLSRIEAGRLDLDLGAIDINKIITDSVAIMQPQAYRERVIMRTSLSARLPRVLADDRTARQIVLNLLSNAVKFNEPGGQVIVSTALNDTSGIAVRIRDTGIGMSDGDIAAALEPFRQLASSKSVSGTGLGLPLTKALIGANNATMSIRSRPKEGTLVEVIFAAAAASPALPARVPA